MNKTRTSIAAVGLLVLLGIGALWLSRGRSVTERIAAPAAAGAGAKPAAPRASSVAPPIPNAQPGQARALVEPGDAEGGVLSGRVINWSRGDGVANAELTFVSDDGATTVRTRDDGAFELAPPAPGAFVLSAVAAPGFLPYAPELSHSTVHVVLARHQVVRGITVFLFPALDYHGTVVDARGAPAAGARVRLLGTPAGEQAIDKLATEWTADRDGRFVFHAADEAVLEASRGSARGTAQLDRSVMITRQLTIVLGNEPARDAIITGTVSDTSGAPLGDVLVRATPHDGPPPGPAGSSAPRPAPGPGPGPTDDPVRATAFATTGADGTFTLTGLDRRHYALDAEAEGFAPAELADVVGGTRGVKLTLDGGLPLAGAVSDADGKPIPAYTLLVLRRDGARRVLAVERSIVEPSGRFEVRVTAGDYELIASASGWAPNAPVQAAAGATDVKLVLGAGATLRGTVVASEDGRPIAYARVTREGRSGGASVQPANAGTVTRPDGSFELTGIPAGPLSISVTAGDYNQRIEAAMTASDGQTLGPITIALSRVAEGQQPTTELVGIGVALSTSRDALNVDRVIPGGGAEAAGIVAGDRVIAVDGASVIPLGLDGAIAKIRGVVGTTVAITLQRGDDAVQLVVQRRKIRA